MQGKIFHWHKYHSVMQAIYNEQSTHNQINSNMMSVSKVSLGIPCVTSNNCLLLKVKSHRHQSTKSVVTLVIEVKSYTHQSTKSVFTLVLEEASLPLKHTSLSRTHASADPLVLGYTPARYSHGVSSTGPLHSSHSLLWLHSSVVTRHWL